MAPVQQEPSISNLYSGSLTSTPENAAVSLITYPNGVGFIGEMVFDSQPYSAALATLRSPTEPAHIYHGDSWVISACPPFAGSPFMSQGFFTHFQCLRSGETRPPVPNVAVPPATTTPPTPIQGSAFHVPPGRAGRCSQPADLLHRLRAGTPALAAPRPPTDPSAHPLGAADPAAAPPPPGCGASRQPPLPGGAPSSSGHPARSGIGAADGAAGPPGSADSDPAPGRPAAARIAPVRVVGPALGRGRTGHHLCRV